MKKILLTVFSLLSATLILVRCELDPDIPEGPAEWEYDPTPFEVVRPAGLPPFPYDLLNPANEFTVEGVSLGRKLFYDPILSADSSLSCSSCHSVNKAFSDSTQFSIGVDGLPGKRNSMPIFNLAYSPYDNGFFWDGRAATLEVQALLPIQDPLEMHEVLPVVIDKLSRSEYYPELFYNAFGIEAITPEWVGNAIAQFTKSIVSGNSKYDLATTPGSGVFFTEQEIEGFNLFNDLEGGDCFHCHGVNGGLFTDYQYRNNGLINANSYLDFSDPGFGAITGDTADYGKFKTPSLRNIELTGPYMHDGRFSTLEEVLDFYSTEVHDTPFTDSFMQFASEGGVQLTEDEKAAIIAFLKTLTDYGLKDNPAYQNPW